ncbi:MAG: hypothetical protein V3S41_00675, partial [Spirochaetia bacterium]
MKKMNCLHCSVFVALLVMSGCSDSFGGGTQIDYPDIQTGWTAHAFNPVITAGDALAGAEWNDPSVIKQGPSSYVM